jgi:serine phosphatase RsbU (regulator of sigma subunit)
LGRERPVLLEALHVFDVVAPSLLPEQLVAEAQRVAGVPVALYVVDIDGTHLLRVAGPDRFPELIEAPLAIGPELDADGLAELRARFHEKEGMGLIPLWLRGRATGVLLTLGEVREDVTDLARQASAAITLADRYSDTFARAQRRKQPRAAAEIQQSLLPPRIMRISHGEVAGNVLPSYEVAGDWYDVSDNLDGVWISIADGLGPSTRAAAASAVALGALRASRRSGGSIVEALLTMHHTLAEMPGPKSEMAGLVTRWDPATYELEIANCGHVAPFVLHEDGTLRRPCGVTRGRGLGGRATPRPDTERVPLQPGDRLILASNGVVDTGEGLAGLGEAGVVEAALSSPSGSAADTVRRIHSAVLEPSVAELTDDATAVCLAVG